MISSMVNTFRRHHLMVFVTFGLLVMLGAIFFELDRQYFQFAKRRYITENWTQMFPLPKNELLNASRQLLSTHTEPEQQRLSASLAETFLQITNSPLSIYRIELRDASQQTVLAHVDLEKFRHYNRFSNSLFLRNFSSMGDLLISGSEGKELGRLVIYYTTPLNDPFIRRLAVQYKFIALGFVLILGLPYYYLLRYLIIPAKRVVSYVDVARTRLPSAIKNPSTLLERSYNQIVRQALLNIMSDRVHHFISRQQPDLSEVLNYIPRLLEEVFSLSRISLAEVRRQQDGTLEQVYMFGSQAGELQQQLGSIEALLSSALADAQRFSLEHEGWWWELVYRGEENDWLILLVVPLSEQSEWHKEMLPMLGEQLRASLVAFEHQHTQMMEEKSRANINLTRHLGHDLTNLIATSKLDLVTIKESLKNLDRGSASPQVLEEAVDSLLRNTFVLQEVVNIYRSFSFVREPHYEKVAPNELIREVAELFEYTLSRSVIVELDLEPEIPQWELEQRLFKLCLFNLLSNAAEAIRHRTLEDPTQGRITISSHYYAQQQELQVKVRDNGTGITNTEGEPLPSGELDKLFIPGYSTKPGGGMGLSWVRTIVRDFHRGRLMARNCQPRGAEFTISFPSKTRIELKVK